MTWLTKLILTATLVEAVVVTLAVPNPYPPESRDAQIFDALEPAPEQLSLMLTLK